LDKVNVNSLINVPIIGYTKATYMRIKPKFLQSKTATPYQANSYGHYSPDKHYSRKKIITPINSEAEIRAARSSNKASVSSVKTKVNVKNDSHLISASSAKMSAEMKTIPLFNRLDDKVRRRRKLYVIIGQILFWGAILHIFVFSKIPGLLTALSR
jgi:hypothetical protein